MNLHQQTLDLINAVRGTKNSLTVLEEIKELSLEELLKRALDQGIIDRTSVEEKLEVKQYEEILKQHPYAIWKSEKREEWCTYIPDETKKRKKALRRRKSREEIEQLIVNLWKSQEREKKRKAKHSFEDVYFLWREYQDQLVVQNTVAKYESDRKRFFDKMELPIMNIKNIDIYNIDVFMVQNIKKYELQKEATRKLFGYITRTMEYAKAKGFIERNPVENISSKRYYQYCHEKYKSKEEQVISSEDMQLLQRQFRKDHETKPNYVPTYAVELASLTGMRVAEIAALRWDHIFEGYILVELSEKSNSKKNKFWIDTTKNKKTRKFPMTEEIRQLLKKIKQVEEEYGYSCEWVFADEKGRIHAPRISACAKTKCRQLGINPIGKGIHGYRKTLNSKMRQIGVSCPQAAAMLGHSEEVNRKYYTFDISGDEEKSRIISLINHETFTI